MFEHLFIVLGLVANCSWVQNQEREHLDELWQGGMEDYLKHATTIMVGAWNPLCAPAPFQPCLICNSFENV